MKIEAGSSQFTWEDFINLTPNSSPEFLLPAAAIGGMRILPETQAKIPKLGRRGMLALSTASVIAINMAANGLSVPTAQAADRVNHPTPESARINQLFQKGQTVKSPLGFRLLDEELEEYILVPDQNLAKKLRESSDPFSIVQIQDPYLNEETGLRNEAYVMHDRRPGQVGQNFAVKWAVGDFENPHGLWMTTWFGEDKLKEINWLYTKWHSVETEAGKGSLMENVQFLNAESQRLPIPQRFTVPPRRLPGVMPPTT